MPRVTRCSLIAAFLARGVALATTSSNRGAWSGSDLILNSQQFLCERLVLSNQHFNVMIDGIWDILIRLYDKQVSLTSIQNTSQAANGRATFCGVCCSDWLKAYMFQPLQRLESQPPTSYKIYEFASCIGETFSSHLVGCVWPFSLVFFCVTYLDVSWCRCLWSDLYRVRSQGSTQGELIRESLKVPGTECRMFRQVFLILHSCLASAAMLERSELCCLDDAAVEVTMSQHKAHHGALASQTMPETQLELATRVANFGKFWLQLMPPRRRWTRPTSSTVQWHIRRALWKLLQLVLLVLTLGSQEGLVKSLSNPIILEHRTWLWSRCRRSWRTGRWKLTTLQLLGPNFLAPCQELSGTVLGTSIPSQQVAASTASM